jgi:hypothetical protein
MSIYTIRVLKDGCQVRDFVITPSAGEDPENEFTDGEPVIWTEAEADGWFEQDLESLLEPWTKRGGYAAGLEFASIVGEAGDPKAARP